MGELCLAAASSSKYFFAFFLINFHEWAWSSYQFSKTLKKSHLEHTRRIEALIKLVPQTILQLYIIWYVIDHTEQDLVVQLKCLKTTWILTGVSILKFSLDASLNVKEFDLHQNIRYFKRSELEEAKEFYADNSVPGKTPLCLLYQMCAITSRCIFISLMLYYIPGHYPHVLTTMFVSHLVLMVKVYPNFTLMVFDLKFLKPYPSSTNSSDWLVLEINVRGDWPKSRKEKPQNNVDLLVFSNGVTMDIYRLG